LDAPLEATRQALRKAGRADLLRRPRMVVGDAKKREARALQVGERPAGGVVAVARLAGRADDGEPLAVACGRDRRARPPPGTERASGRPPVVEALLLPGGAEEEPRARPAPAFRGRPGGRGLAS